MKSEKELKAIAIEIHVQEMRDESSEVINRAVRKAEAFFYLLIALTISLSAVLAQVIIKGFDLLGILILIFGLIIEVRTIKEIMSCESALVEGAKLAIFVGKRLEEKEREELIGKAETAEAARAAKAKAAEKKTAPKTRKPRTKKTAEADEKPSKKASTK
jgi:ribosomal protein L12E/L44/L45/RPP1/RPP2